MSSSPFNDLGDVDAVVSRDVLVSYSTCYTEAQTWTRTRGRQAVFCVQETFGYVFLCPCVCYLWVLSPV